ncbi:cytokine receptor family member B16 isoform X3 [Nerophis ophidion]|uniref:cytokine receptor family member B16 isoform X3 n=1 Tax=Nerophis ophidion TaxID=159077 RepID=UPI002ADF31C6|nr:cytokine receptor family member B16 isoform X3 [Nerophis ophidion]
MAPWLLRIFMRIFMLFLLYLDLIHCILMLQPPGRLTMESINMRHTLRWRPLQTPCSTAVLYSVQYQGEFERTAPYITWLDVSECQNTTSTHCDVTLDLVSDSDYNIRVRAQCESQISQWNYLSPPFNRKDTLLTVPQMAVSAVGYTLLVTFDQAPPTASINVAVWKRGGRLHHLGGGEGAPCRRPAGGSGVLPQSAHDPGAAEPNGQHRNPLCAYQRCTCSLEEHHDCGGHSGPHGGCPPCHLLDRGPLPGTRLPPVF